MKYTTEFLLDFMKKYNEVDAFLNERIEEIGKTMGFLDNVWGLESYEIDIERKQVYIVAYDVMYDLHDTKNTSIPLDWICNENWKEEWEEQEKKRKELEEAKALIEERAKKEREEKADYELYLKLKEKFE